MKRIIMFVLLFAALKVAGQTTGYLRFDTVKIMKQNGTCELYVINKTKDSLGVLTNVGGGLTQFKKPRVLSDSTFVIGNDTLIIIGRPGTTLTNASASGDTLLISNTIKRLDHDATLVFSTNASKILMGADTISWVASIPRLTDTARVLRDLIAVGGDSLGRFYSLKKLGISDDADIRIGSTTFGTNQATQLQAVLDKALAGPITILWDVHTSTDTTLYIRSNTRIIFAPGCGIILRDSANCNVFMNKNRTTSAIQDSNIVLTGNDWIINGNGGKQIHDTEANGWVAGVRFVGANNVTVEGGSIVAARSFHLWFMNANYIKIFNLKIDYAPGYNTNQYGTFDGIHLNGPMRFIEVKNLVAKVFDDAIGTNADDVWQNTDPEGVCEVCSNASSYDPWAGNGAIEDFSYDGITFMDSCLFGLRFLSGVSPIRRGTITNLKGTTSLQVVIMDNWSEGEPAHPGPGLIEDIVFDKIYAEVEPRESYTYKNTYFSLGCKMNNITFRNVGRSLFSNGTYPTFNIDANAYIQGLTIDGLNHRGQLSADVPWMRVGGYVNNLKFNDVTNSAPTSLINNSLIKLTSTGHIKTLQLNSIHIDSSMSMIDIEDGIIDTIHANNIIHSGNGGNTWLYTESAVSRLVLSNYTGGTIYTLGTGGSVGSTSGDAFTASAATLDDVLTAGATSTQSASMGGLSITAPSGTNRTNQFSNNSASDNFASIDLRPPSGTDVSSSFRIIPRGAASIRGDLQIFNTDYVADGTNWELLLQRANSTEYLLWSLANGTGTVRPIKMLTGSNTDQFNLLTNGNVSMSGSLAVTGDVTVADEAYDATAWNGSLEVPTKNAVRDKLEEIGTGSNISNSSLSWDNDYTQDVNYNQLFFDTVKTGRLMSYGYATGNKAQVTWDTTASALRRSVRKTDNSADSILLSAFAGNSAGTEQVGLSYFSNPFLSSVTAKRSSVEILTTNNSGGNLVANGAGITIVPGNITIIAKDSLEIPATPASTADSVFAVGSPDPVSATNKVLKIPLWLKGTTSWTPGIVAAGSSTSTTITVTGAVVGDPVTVSKKSGLSNGEIYDASVTAPNTVTLRVHNVSTGSANYSSAADYNVIVLKY